MRFVILAGCGVPILSLFLCLLDEYRLPFQLSTEGEKGGNLSNKKEKRKKKKVHQEFRNRWIYVIGKCRVTRAWEKLIEIRNDDSFTHVALSFVMEFNILSKCVNFNKTA